MTVSGKNEGVTSSAHGASTAAAGKSRDVTLPWAKWSDEQRRIVANLCDEQARLCFEVGAERGLEAYIGLRDAILDRSCPLHRREAIAEIAAERQRQVESEGWTPEHDDTHAGGEMARAAGCYALHAGLPTPAQVHPGYAPQDWPWDAMWWKPKSRRHDLIRSAALIVAEIERLDRSRLKPAAASEQSSNCEAVTNNSEPSP